MAVVKSWASLKIGERAVRVTAVPISRAMVSSEPATICAMMTSR